MDILKLIKKDHQEAKKLIRALEKKAESGSAEVTTMAKKLALEVLLHAKSEERALYTACEKYNKNFRDFSLEGYIEHQLIEKTLLKLVATAPGKDGEFKAVLTVVKELLEHHAEEEEEEEMFPKIKKAFDSEMREELGQHMEAFKMDLRPKLESRLGFTRRRQERAEQQQMMTH